MLLGAVVALTGPNAAWGQRTWNGFQLACDLVNAEGGIKSMGGAKLKYFVVDTESKPEVAGTQTEKAIQRGAAAITGTNQSAATVVATQIAEREGVPFVCATDVDPLITARGFKYTFRTSPVVESYARDLLAYIRELSDKAGKPARKLAVLSENSIVGQSSVEGATKVGEGARLRDRRHRHLRRRPRPRTSPATSPSSRAPASRCSSATTSRATPS